MWIPNLQNTIWKGISSIILGSSFYMGKVFSKFRTPNPIVLYGLARLMGILELQKCGIFWRWHFLWFGTTQWHGRRECSCRRRGWGERPPPQKKNVWTRFALAWAALIRGRRMGRGRVNQFGGICPKSMVGTPPYTGGRGGRQLWRQNGGRMGI